MSIQKSFRNIALLAATIAANSVFSGTLAITDVTAQVQHLRNGVIRNVEIVYTLTGSIEAETNNRGLLTSVSVTATDSEANKIYTAINLFGDIGVNPGTHMCVWDMEAEGLSLNLSNVTFSVLC